MANTKTTNTKAKTTNAKTSKEVKQTVADVNIDIDAIKSELEAKIKAELEAKIKAEMEAKTKAELMAQAMTSINPMNYKEPRYPVQSVFYGSISFVSETTKKKYSWEKKGDIRNLTKDEIYDMNVTDSLLIHAPYVQILDDEIAEDLGMTEVYDAIKEVKDVKAFIDRDREKIKDILDKLPEAFKFDLRDEIAVYDSEGYIDSGLKRRLFQKELGVDLGLKI